MTDTLSIPYYPINDFGPAMKGVVIGALGIFRVFLAQFAIGGGLLMCYSVGGLWVFLAFAALNAVLVAWCLWTVTKRVGLDQSALSGNRRM